MAPNIEIHKPVDPHLRRWMLFVDGENFTMRAQKLAENTALRLQEGAEYRKDIFVWFPGLKAALSTYRGLYNRSLVCDSCLMNTPARRDHYKHHRFPLEIISQGVWLYFRCAPRGAMMS
jgi:hypothetical protein